MAINYDLTKKNLTRWINASINDHFATVLTPNIFVFVEGDTRKTREESDFVEVRVDGPLIKEASHGFFYITCEVNCLVNSVVNDNNLYGLDINIGLVEVAFTRALPIYRYGDGVDDDQSLLGCLKLIDDRRNSLDVFKLGRMLIEAPIMRATVEGHYKMDLCMEVI